MKSQLKALFLTYKSHLVIFRIKHDITQKYHFNSIKLSNIWQSISSFHYSIAKNGIVMQRCNPYGETTKNQEIKKICVHLVLIKFNPFLFLYTILILIIPFMLSSTHSIGKKIKRV